MRRRSFLKSVTIGAASVPIVAWKPPETLPPQETEDELQEFVIQDELGLQKMPTVEGLSSGVASIDEITNGFHPKQLVSVFGPLEHINTSMIAGAAFHNALKGRKVDFVISERSFDDYYDMIYHGSSPTFHKNIKDILFKQSDNRRPNLRVHSIDLGDPKNDGWKKCVEAVKSDPPEIIFLDGVKYLEMLLEEPHLAKQLKTLAMDLEMPVVVQAPTYRKNGLRTENGKSIRSDFDEFGDAFIGLIPEFVCDYRYSKTESKKYFQLQTTVCADWCPCSEHKAYSAEFKLQYSEPFAYFKAV